MKIRRPLLAALLATGLFAQTPAATSATELETVLTYFEPDL